MTKRTKGLIAGIVVCVAAVTLALLLSPFSPALRRQVRNAFDRVGIDLRSGTGAQEASAPDRLPALPAEGWLNGGPLDADSLRGSIVVLAVFSDTHPTALEALPQLEAWHEAYARFGVRIVGVHAPEFAFATQPEVLDRLAARLGLSFPIVRDPSLQVLAALHSRDDEVQVVVADAEGRVRAIRSLENVGNDLAGVESTVRALIAARHPEIPFPEAPAAAASASGPAVRTLRLGASSVLEGPLRGAVVGKAQPFTAQFRFEVEGAPYVPYPVPRPEGLEASKGGAAQFVAIRYDAARVGVVASPPPVGASRLWILRDEAWLTPDALGEDARLDSRGASYVDVDASRLYRVTRGTGEHVLKLSPEDGGLTLHALTFEPRAGPPPDP